MKRLGYIALATLISHLALAQDKKPCACCTEQHQQFDFWVGDWNVSDTAGTAQGSNSIVKLEDGCVLQENWTGASGGTGTSYNYFNPSDDTWNQVWIDNQGRPLELKGGFVNGAMVMRSELQPGKKVDWFYNQISWTPKAKGTVTQRWDVFTKDGKMLNTLFLGIYSPK